MQGTENTAALLGRVAMSLLFIHGGWGKLLAPAATQAMLASHHLPMVKYGWILGSRCRIRRRVGHPVRAVHPSGRAGAGDMVRGHRPDRAHEFR